MTTLTEIVRTAAGALVANHVYLYRAPELPPAELADLFPYLTCTPDLIPRQIGVEGDGRALAWYQAGQVSLWQRVGDESDTLLDDVVRALDGAQSPAPPFLRLRVQYSLKLVEGPLAGDVVQDAITLRAAALR